MAQNCSNKKDMNGWKCNARPLSFLYRKCCATNPFEISWDHCILRWKIWEYLRKQYLLLRNHRPQKPWVNDSHCLSLWERPWVMIVIPCYPMLSHPPPGFFEQQICNMPWPLGKFSMAFRGLPSEDMLNASGGVCSTMEWIIIIMLYHSLSKSGTSARVPQSKKLHHFPSC